MQIICICIFCLRSLSLVAIRNVTRTRN